MSRAHTVEVLRRCGAELSRKCVMDKATNLSDLEVTMPRPGTTVRTTLDNYNLDKKLQMQPFNGQRPADQVQPSRTGRDGADLHSNEAGRD